MNVDIKGDAFIIQTELLIQIFAHQRALGDTILNLITKDEEHLKIALEHKNRQTNAYIDLVLAEIFARHGNIEGLVKPS